MGGSWVIPSVPSLTEHSVCSYSMNKYYDQILKIKKTNKPKPSTKSFYRKNLQMVLFFIAQFFALTEIRKSRVSSVRLWIFYL